MRRNVAELPALVRQVAAWGIPPLRIQNLSHMFSDADPRSRRGGSEYRGVF